MYTIVTILMFLDFFGFQPREEGNLSKRKIGIPTNSPSMQDFNFADDQISPMSATSFARLSASCLFLQAAE